ncbi:three-Cys-motif partner protein TcmP [Bacteroides fragilis]|nr:three-Cys-motif partner protein TcmP [Bacteroides fragilis]MCE9334480.1 three-Cys-motif partner protein TcmP [Bacteroides fragilis]MCS2489620.1 three-Cys-motif partner protein TcmP [Bacteroides fragilis]UVQ86129.1 three-Cys-motif partner protein TcmP [Bacteroides fragilis]
MKNTDFFEQQTISSRVKAGIVADYFPQYCKIIIKRRMPESIRFIDLFSGPGVYEDGNVSTPILVGRKCMQDNFLKTHVQFIFNDNEYIEQLKENFDNEFPCGTFTKQAFFRDRTVGECEAIYEYLEASTHKNGYNSSPALLFFDPFGYKGMKTASLAKFLENWGNEVFIFINTKRINPALENDKFEDLMRLWFPTTYEQIKTERNNTRTVSERLNLIINNLGKEFSNSLRSNVYYTAFRFQEEDIETTSHYILHITKGSKGFELVKTVYNNFANVDTIFDGINTYTFDAKKVKDNTASLFDVKEENIQLLKEDLLAKYKGRSISSKDLHDEHHKNCLYTSIHYRTALRKLKEEDKIQVVYTDDKQHRASVLIDRNCILKFN